MKTLYPYQQASLEKSLSNIGQHGFFLLLDEMGLGKTIQALAYMDTTKPEKTLIICPPFLKLNWLTELKDNGYDLKTVDVVESGKQILRDQPITIVGYSVASQSSITNQLSRFKFDLMIFDEIHYLRNLKTSRRHFFKPFIQRAKRLPEIRLVGYSNCQFSSRYL